MPKKIDNNTALTLDIKKDGWEQSRGFIMRQIPMPMLDEKKNREDAGSVILKINYAGVCGSDRGIWQRSSFKDLIHDSLQKEKKSLRILGHEFIGQVVATGSLAGMVSDISVGDWVSGDSHITCGKCYQCRLGENHVCTNEKILGISTDGIFANYVKIPAKNLWKVDIKKIRPEIAAMYDPFGNAVHATTKVDVRGQSVAVFGCGAIGLFSVALLKHFGATNIIAVDTSTENLTMAKALGADEVIQIKAGSQNTFLHNPDVVKKIMQMTGGLGVDIAMEMAGPNSSLNNGIESARRGGHVMLFGLKDGDFTIPKFSRVVTKGLTLHGVIGRRIFQTWQMADRVLADTGNGVQEKIWNVILKGGKGTVLNFTDFNKEKFEKAMQENPKIIFKIS